MRPKAAILDTFFTHNALKRSYPRALFHPLRSPRIAVDWLGQVCRRANIHNIFSFVASAVGCIVISSIRSIGYTAGELSFSNSTHCWWICFQKYVMRNFPEWHFLFSIYTCIFSCQVSDREERQIRSFIRLWHRHLCRKTLGKMIIEMPNQWFMQRVPTRKQRYFSGLSK